RRRAGASLFSLHRSQALAISPQSLRPADERPLTRRFAPPSPRFAGRGTSRHQGPVSHGDKRDSPPPQPSSLTSSVPAICTTRRGGCAMLRKTFALTVPILFIAAACGSGGLGGASSISLDQ